MNPGDLASTTDTVLRVVDPRRLDVVAIVADADVPRVVPGASARLKSGNLVIRLPVAGRAGNAVTPDTATVRLTFVDPSSVPVDIAVEVDIDAEERIGASLFPPRRSCAREVTLDARRCYLSPRAIPRSGER